MKKRKYLIIACAIILLAGSLYYFMKEEPANPPQAAQEAGDNKPVFLGNSIVEEDNGKRLWELKADRIEVDPKTKMAKLINLRGIFYKEDGSHIEITAPEAIVDANTKDITMTGSVKAVASDGSTFIAREARWEGKRRYLYGSGGVTLTKDDTVITGDQIESDANMEKVKVQGNARVVKGGASQ